MLIQSLLRGVFGDGILIGVRDGRSIFHSWMKRRKLRFQRNMTLSNAMTDLEKEIQKIQDRNKRVELDKAWETSKFRKIVIAVLTYFVIVLFFVFAGLPNPFVNAIVPTLGFILSTLSLPLFKKVWLKYVHK